MKKLIYLLISLLFVNGVIQAKTLCDAVISGREEIVKDLLKAGADPSVADKWGRTPLYYAISRGFRPIVQMLLETGKVDVNAKDSNNDGTMLHVAVEGGYDGIVEDLLKAGADPSVASKYMDATPLQCATSRGFRSIVKMLKTTEII